MKRSDISPMPVFFDRYINLIEDIDLLKGFNKYTPEGVYGEIDKLEKLGDKVYEADKWTIQDILQHVIDNERIMSYRALRFSRADETELPGYEEALLAANTNAGNRSLQDLMSEFTLVRAATIALFQSMNDQMLLRVGTASQTKISSLALGFVILGHPVHHMNVIHERYFPLL